MLKPKNCWIGLVIVLLLALGCVPYGGSNTLHAWDRNPSPVYPLETQRALVQRLAFSKIQVVEQGDHLRVLIPTDDFFDLEKPTLLKMSKQPALVWVAKLVLLYGSRPLTVQGHSDNIGYDKNNAERTRQQANVVAGFLWSQGVDQGRMHIHGYGSHSPIASNATMEGREMNRRIEIRI